MKHKIFVIGAALSIILALVNHYSAFQIHLLIIFTPIIIGTIITSIKFAVEFIFLLIAWIVLMIITFII